MNIRRTILALCCVGSLALVGCSSPMPGTPSATGDSVAAPSDEGGAAGSVADTASAGDGGDSGDTASAEPSDGDSASIPTDATDLAGALSALPSLTDVLGGECMQVATIVMAAGFLLASPLTGGSSITAQQVDEAFNGMADAPAELQAPLAVVHDAAVAATGKSTQEASTILGSDEVTAAMEQITEYLDSACGGGN